MPDKIYGHMLRKCGNSMTSNANIEIYEPNYLKSVSISFKYQPWVVWRFNTLEDLDKLC